MTFIILILISNIKNNQKSSAIASIKTWDFSNDQDYRYNPLEIKMQSNLANLNQLPTEIKFDGDNPLDQDFHYYQSQVGRVTIVDDATNPGNNVYRVNRGASSFSNIKVPIRSDLQYRYSVRSRRDSTTPLDTRDFFGLRARDQFNNFIYNSEMVYRGDPATIVNVNDHQINTSGADLSTWNQGGVTAAHGRLLNFYYDGNYANRRPDALLACGVTSNKYLNQGTYSVAQSDIIYLNCDIPEDIANNIIDGTTVVTNTFLGASANWACIESDLDVTWRTCQDKVFTLGTSTGSNFNLLRFGIGTRRFAILNSNNYFRDQRYTVYFDDVTLQIEGNQPPYSWAAPEIRPKTGYHFDGRPISFADQLEAGTSADKVKYQVSSDNGQTWKWWNGTTWSEVDHRMDIGSNPGYGIPREIIYSTTLPETQTNTAAEINAHIADLDSDGGDFTWKAFLLSDQDNDGVLDGNESVGLKEVTFTGQLLPTVPQDLLAKQVTEPAPTILNPLAVNSHNEVKLTWAEPSNNGSSLIGGYKVAYKLSSEDDSHWQEVNLPSTAREHVFGNLIYTNDYDFRVIAYTGVGDSPVALVEGINIKDTTAPDLLGVKDSELKGVIEGEEYDLRSGVTASDNADGDITDKIQVYGGPVDTSKAGTEYSLVYIAEDSSHNKTVKTRLIKIVKNKEELENLSALRLPNTGTLKGKIFYLVLSASVLIGLFVIRRHILKKKRVNR